MNAPLSHPLAPATQRTSSIIGLSEWLENPDPAWHTIALRPSEANPFAESWFVAASADHLAVPASTRMLTVYEAGQLIGLMPICVATGYGRMPIAHVQNWQHYNSFFGAPLVRRAFEPLFWSRALELLDADSAAPAFLHVTGLDGDGPLAAALLQARSGAAIVHRMRRALLKSDLDPQTYYETTVRKKKRKEIGRLCARLDEQGQVRFRRLAGEAELDAWIDTFLALEASGWKGSAGNALANDDATAAFTRSAMHGAFAAGRLEIVRLDLDERAIAMLVNFVTPPGSYSFKIAFDEDYARFSPGVLIQIENFKILDRPEIDWMDSCAVEGHPMIESLWGERREIVRISVPLTGWRRRATFSTCRALETLSASLKRSK